MPAVASAGKRPNLKFACALLFLTVQTGLGCTRSDRAPTDSPRTVVLVSIDTLRADHLGCYGYGRNTSPNLDQLAKESVIFDAAFAQATFTLPSHMSLLTSLYPDTHGVLTPSQTDSAPYLSGEVTTLAEALQNDGFITAGFADGGYVGAAFGFDQGFDRYDSFLGRFRGGNADVLAWIQNHRRDDFFLFLHTFDVHGPYAAPKTFSTQFSGQPPGRKLPNASLLPASLLKCHDSIDLTRFDRLQDLVDEYDRCIAFVDHELARIFETLKELDRWDEALVVVTSDHGELFLDNGVMVGHGLFATTEESRIPLIFKFPGGRLANRRSDHIVESVDVLPTILTALGIDSPPECAGQDLAKGVEENIWAKDFAFGSSPNTGNNHYYIEGTMKFEEGIDDRRFQFVRWHLQPNLAAVLIPGGKPSSPALFYDFDEDPLAVRQALYHGDRIVDLSQGWRDWKAPLIDDEEKISHLREKVRALVEKAKEQGRHYRVPLGSQTIAPSTLSALQAMGYVGAAAPTEDKEPHESKAPREEDDEPSSPGSPANLLSPALHQGDEILWRFSRDPTAIQRELNDAEKAKLFEARSAYREFAKEHPESAIYLEWRLRAIRLLLREK